MEIWEKKGMRSRQTSRYIRIISILLTLFLCVNYLPVTVLAEVNPGRETGGGPERAHSPGQAPGSREHGDRHKDGGGRGL